MQLNPLAERIATMFCDTNGRVCFANFAHALNPFHASATPDDKMRFVFRVFDIDQQERISSDNLFCILRKIVGEAVQPV